MATTHGSEQPLVAWFRAHGGVFDDGIIGFTSFAGSGRGAIALSDIPEGAVLFTLPRGLTLSTRTSQLPTLLGPTWAKHGLGKGWVGLILCMLWEEARGAQSPWDGYLASLPTQFDTPMFWGEEDVAELAGTAVVDKIGRADAEQDYHSKLLPVIQERPDLFPIQEAYTLDKYHMMGSRVLSRSFTVQRWRASDDPENDNTAAEEDNDAEDDDEAAAAANLSQSSAGMEVDQDAGMDAIVAEAQGTAAAANEGEDNDDNEEDDEEDPGDVAMVPMADMLNARYGCENAKLFYEQTELRMITTKPIPKGEQIFNTYGDPPNSDLLRRYGHVDEIADHASPADIVELRADLVIASLSPASRKRSEERVEWWLDEGGDDLFVIETDLALPDGLVSFVRLLLLDAAEWTKTRDKGKVPKPKPVDGPVLRILVVVLEKRLSEYSTSLEDDERTLEDIDSLPLNRRHALIVRVGEKRILVGVQKRMQEMLKAAAGEKEKSKGGKRKAEKEEGRGKRARR